MLKEYSINDLPRFSHWPARLLGMETWERKYNTPAEVAREYDREKWGPLLTRARRATWSLKVEDVDQWHYGREPDPICSIEDRFFQMSWLEACRYYLDLIETTLKPLLPASTLVELGAGYGSVILKLAQRQAFANMRLIAGDYTTSGVELLKLLGEARGLNLKVGHCDFTISPMFEYDLPSNALVLTSYAATEVPILAAEYVHELCYYHPRAVVHFEACYEHSDDKNLIGLMRRRYIEVNDYNTNLVSLLHEQQASGKIEILTEKPALYGTNPFLVASLLIWKPA